MKNIKRGILTLLIITVQHCVYAQSQQIDSLNALISKTGNDSARINLLIQKSKAAKYH